MRKITKEEYINKYVVGNDTLICYKTGKYIRFSPEDYDKVLEYAWAISTKRSRNKLTDYVYASTLDGDSPGHNLALHRHLTNAQSGLVVDHINGNTLDNRQCNLRVCSHRDNLVNRKKPNCNNKLQIRGVSENKNSKLKPWRAQFRGKYIGCFKTIDEAVAAYNKHVASVEFATSTGGE